MGFNWKFFEGLHSLCLVYIFRERAPMPIMPPIALLNQRNKMYITEAQIGGRGKSIGLFFGVVDCQESYWILLTSSPSRLSRGAEMKARLRVLSAGFPVTGILLLVRTSVSPEVTLFTMPLLEAIYCDKPEGRIVAQNERESRKGWMEILNTVVLNWRSLYVFDVLEKKKKKKKKNWREEERKEKKATLK